MSGLFSHASADGDAPSDRPDIQSTVSVPASADHAWAGLVEHLHLWWPADLLSRWGTDSFFDLEDNALVETSAEDDENVWGEVTDSASGQWMLLRWRAAGSTTITDLRLGVREDAGVLDRARIEAAAEGTSGSGGAEVVDQAEGDGPVETTLDLTHSGWTSADPHDLYDFYRQFWPEALARYRRFMGGS